jgi:NAD(P)-dependent dehydrogenase (short-subunit alcohol dehydrogenase family)
MENLTKKSIVVTGASGGLGKAVVNALKNEFNVFCLDLKPTDLNDKNVFDVFCDVTSETSVLDAYQEVLKHTQSIYAIIHTAGIYDLNSLIEVEEDKLQKIFEVNFFGAYRINKAFYKMLSKGSRIILTTSELAPLDPLPFTGIYAITKSTLEKYAHSLRMELSLKGIFVSVIRPGAIKTNLLGDSTRALDRFCQNTYEYPVNSKRFKSIVNSVESKCVEPKKIAKLIKKATLIKKPRLTYNINRNFLLKLLNVLPKKLQLFIIKQILK